MKSANIFLGTINDAKEFVSIASRYDFEIDLVCGRYAVDAKSLMGIFSLELTRPLQVNVQTDEPGDFFEQIARFAADRDSEL